MNEEDIAKDGRRKWTLKMVQDLAINRGGKLISIEYKNTNEKLIWECGTCFNQWAANINHISGKNTWCPNCNLNICTIDQAYKIAKLKNGKCLTLSENFKNGGQKLNWECHLGHQWFASLYKVKNSNRWCPKCAGTQKYTYEEVKSEIELRGWKLLSKKYNNYNTKLEIKCKNNHIFYESLGKIIHRGHGCKYCNTVNISENICRIYIETIFSNKFPTVRLSCMEGLELDGYCSELGIAFEHQGEQHYSLKALQGIYKNSTEYDFLELQKRDKQKIELCNKFGIKLIMIPSLFQRTKLKDLKCFIKNECSNLHINMNSDIDNIKIPIEIIYNKKNISYDEMYNLYIRENKKCKEICEMYNLTRDKFYNLLKMFCIYKKGTNE